MNRTAKYRAEAPTHPTPRTPAPGEPVKQPRDPLTRPSPPEIEPPLREPDQPLPPDQNPPERTPNPTPVRSARIFLL